MSNQNKTLTQKQQRVYDFIRNYLRRNKESPTVLEILKMLKASSLRSVTQYLESLEKKGLIRRKWHQKRGIEIIESSSGEEVVSLPVFASAGCGNPSIIAEHTYDEFVTVSKALVPDKKKEELYVIRAIGKSMEDAGIRNDDLVIVEKTNRVVNNDLIVAIIDDTAVIKKITFTNNAVILSPVTSDKSYQTLILRRNFEVFGKVIDVIKKPEDNDEIEIIPIKDY